MTPDVVRTIGPWVCVEQLGVGGNGTVWRAAPADGGSEVALKVLMSKKPTAEPYRRFVREVEFLQKLGDYGGVLPVISANLPGEPTGDDRPWLAMPIATPIAPALENRPLRDVVEAVGAIADTLARLIEDHGVGHRDIKPGNLYELDGAWLVGDFGLIDVPDVEELTRSNRPLGPANFTAYEVILDPKNAASGPADVYSVGKSLWVLATGVNWPPLGHQSAEDSGYRISDSRPHQKARELDQLVDRTTRLDPSARPTMRQVAADLSAWQRLTPDPLAIDVSDLRASLRAKLADEFAARDIQQERIELAQAAVRSLRERAQPLNDALRDVHPGVQIDLSADELTDTMLVKQHSHRRHTTLFSWVRCSTISVGEEHWPFVLQMGRCLELLDDGMLHARWMLHVGPARAAGSDLLDTSEDFNAPVGSVQQEEMLDQFVADLRGRLAEALKVFVEKIPGG